MTFMFLGKPATNNLSVPVSLTNAYL